MFWQQTKQVALNYLTLRWIWLILGFVLLMTGGAYLAVRSGVMPGVWAANGLGFPIFMGLVWLMMIAKWQFANPRARLLPHFAGPHLSVLVSLVLLILVANPLCLSSFGGLSKLGSLAYALLLGGFIVWGTRPGANWLTLPGLAVFFSGMTTPGTRFWFELPNRFDALHTALAVAGGAMVVGWLWHLARLDEEMDDYQVLPMGNPGGFSRMERAEQRKLMGRVMARRGITQILADRWHDRLGRLPAGSESRPLLMHYGFGRISGVTRALLAGLGFVLYGVFLNQFIYTKAGGNAAGPATGMMMLTVQWAMAIPAFVAGLMMVQRLPRMAQELLRPATRAEYCDSLFLALAKQSFWLWLALQVGIVAITLATGSFADENLLSLAISYSLISLAAQVPTFGFSLWVVRKISTWRFLLGLYGVMIFQMVVLGAWWAGRKEWGDLVTVPLLLALLLAAGAKMIAWSRNAWLRLELG